MVAVVVPFVVAVLVELVVPDVVVVDEGIVMFRPVSVVCPKSVDDSIRRATPIESAFKLRGIMIGVRRSNKETMMT